MAGEGDGNKPAGVDAGKPAGAPDGSAKTDGGQKPAAPQGGKPDAGVQIPEKFKGKKPEEIIKSYVELERLHGTTSNKVREYEEMLSQLKPYEQEILAMMTGEPGKPAKTDGKDKPAEDDLDLAAAGVSRDALAKIVSQEIQRLMGPQLKKQQEDDVASLKREFGEDNFLKIASSLRKALADPISKAESFRLAAMRLGIKTSVPAEKPEGDDDAGDDTPPPDNPGRAHVSRSSGRQPSESDVKKATGDLMQRLMNVKPSRKLLGG